MERQDSNRLRPPPRERFAENTIPFDLDRTFEALAHEPHSGIDGHRQITLYKGGPMTVLAILFETGGRLPRHQTDGVLTLQLLSGMVNVHTGPDDDDITVLGESGLLVVQPQVFFSLVARQPTRLLMTLARHGSS